MIYYFNYNQHCEDFRLKIETNESKFILAIIYRHPKQKMLFHKKVCENLSKLDSNKLNYIKCRDAGINTLAKNNPSIKEYFNGFLLGLSY